MCNSSSKTLVLVFCFEVDAGVSMERWIVRDAGSSGGLILAGALDIMIKGAVLYYWQNVKEKSQIGTVLVM